jgi:hypothetical protein
MRALLGVVIIGIFGTVCWRAALYWIESKGSPSDWSVGDTFIVAVSLLLCVAGFYMLFA